jgi:hypothetical protein
MGGKRNQDKGVVRYLTTKWQIVVFVTSEQVWGEDVESDLAYSLERSLQVPVWVYKVVELEKTVYIFPPSRVLEWLIKLELRRLGVEVVE